MSISSSQIKKLMALPGIDDVENGGMDDERFFVHLKDGWDFRVDCDVIRTKSFGSYGEAATAVRRAKKISPTH